MPAITIRPAQPQDAPAIARLYFESAEHHRALEPGRYIIPDAGEILARYTSPAAMVLVATDDSGDVSGFAELSLQQSPDPMHERFTFCHIVEVAVEARLRGQGIGEQLIRAAEEWGRAAGAQYASLEYVASNTRAAALYSRLGYRTASVSAIKPL